MKPIIFSPQETPRVLRMVEYQLSALSTGKRYRLEIKEHREKRSLDANAYYWTLAHKLAEATGIHVSQIYRSSIREIGGVSEHYCGRPESIHRLCESWERNGLGWIAEPYESKLPGMLNVTLYYGSSTYDTRQMSRLIDNVVQDCQAVGIETLPPDRLAAMMEGWHGQNHGATG